MQSDITSEFFINPTTNLQIGSQDYLVAVNLTREQLRNRWQSPVGQRIVAQWRANKFDRKILETLVGKWYDHTDLRGINLSGENLSGVDLSQVDLFNSNLERSSLKSANLEGSYLSECNIRGTKFDYARMKEVLIDNAKFDTKTSFIGVKLRDIDFNLAEQLEDFAFSQQRIANLKRNYPLVAKALWATCDYGRSFPRFLLWCLGITLVFGLIYSLIPGTLVKVGTLQAASNQVGLWDSLYFSILTFATVGSDIQAASVIGKILVVLETTIGYLMTGLLVAILVKRTIGD